MHAKHANRTRLNALPRGDRRPCFHLAGLRRVATPLVIALTICVFSVCLLEFALETLSFDQPHGTAAGGFGTRQNGPCRPGCVLTPRSATSCAVNRDACETPLAEARRTQALAASQARPVSGGSFPYHGNCLSHSRSRRWRDSTLLRRRSAAVRGRLFPSESRHRRDATPVLPASVSHRVPRSPSQRIETSARRCPADIRTGAALCTKERRRC